MSNRQLSFAFATFLVLTASNFTILADQTHIDVKKLREFDFDQSPVAPPATEQRIPASVAAPKPSYMDNLKTDEQTPRAIGESLEFEFGCQQKSLLVKKMNSSRSVASTTLYGKALEDRARIQANHNLVLMKGKSCLKGGMLLHRVKNYTNGFTASVFAKGSQSFQTDFIQLNQGVNEVVFEFKNSSGEKKQEKIFVQFDQI